MHINSYRSFWIGIAGLIALTVFLFFYLAPSYYIAKGKTSLARKDFSQARTYFSNVLILRPRNPVAYAYLGRIALGREDPAREDFYPQADYREAIRNYEKALSLGLQKASPSLHGQSLENLGFANWNIQRYELSNRYYLQKIELYPRASFWARYFIAMDYFERSNEPAKALKILRDAPATTNQNENFLYRIYALLSRLALYFKDYGAMERYAELTIENAAGKTDSHVQTAHINLATAAAQRGDLTKAEREIGVANTLAGNTNAYSCALSAMNVIVKQYREAIDIAQTIQADSADPYRYSLCLSALGRASLELGKKAEAKKYFLEYLEITERFAAKNIFTVRNRERIAEDLKSL